MELAAVGPSRDGRRSLALEKMAAGELAGAREDCGCGREGKRVAAAALARRSSGEP